MTQSITLRSGLAGINGIKYVREFIKLGFRARIHRRPTRNWLAQMNAQPLMADLLKSCPRLMYKIYRPYFSNTMSHDQRVQLLSSHYRFVASKGLGNIVRQAAHAPVELGSVSGKSGALYTIQLCTIGVMEREGELVLQLTDGCDVIYSVAFCFMGAGPQMHIGIGCLQGPNRGDTLARVREATRDLHGMRPKSLMVRLVRQLGHDYGCHKLIMVGNDNRTVHSATRQGKVHADYNALWLELGAQQRSDGDFELDCEDLPAPVMEEIASKKRSEVRKRHETTGAFIATLRHGLQAPRGLPQIRPMAAANDSHAGADDHGFDIAIA